MSKLTIAMNASKDIMETMENDKKNKSIELNDLIKSLEEVQANLSHTKELEKQVGQIPSLLSKEYEKGKKKQLIYLVRNINLKLIYLVRIFKIRLIGNQIELIY